MNERPLFHHVGAANALEIVATGGSLEARRYVVTSRVEHGSDVGRDDVAEEPADRIPLPVPRDVAEGWLRVFFRDLAGREFDTALELMTRSAGLRAGASDLA